MRVVIIIGRFFPHWGGAEIRMKQVAEALTPRGFSFTVLTKRWGSKDPRHENLGGIEIYRFPKWEPLFNQSVRHWLRTHRNQINVVHSIRFDKMGPLGVWANQKLHLPHLADIITNEGLKLLQDGDHAKIQKWNRIVSGTDVVHCLNQEMYQLSLSKDIPASKLWYRPNAVNITRFTPSEQSKSADLPVNLLYSGRLERAKGTDVLIKAWRLLPEDLSKQARLILVGSGKWEAEIREAASDMPNVVFAGVADRETILDHYHSAHICVQPSRFEGFSNTILEAMACGLPVVATAVGGAPDCIRPSENGFLVPSEDSQALAEAMAKLIADRDLRNALGAKSRKIVETEFSFANLFDDYQQMYEKLAGNFR